MQLQKIQHKQTAQVPKLQNKNQYKIKITGYTIFDLTKYMNFFMKMPQITKPPRITCARRLTLFVKTKYPLLTYWGVYDTLNLAVIDMKNEKYSLYPEDFEYYYIVCVHTDEGDRYAYNHRTLTHSIDFATPYNTRRSALRCIRMSDYENAEILVLRRRGDATT